MDTLPYTSLQDPVKSPNCRLLFTVGRFDDHGPVVVSIIVSQ